MSPTARYRSERQQTYSGRGGTWTRGRFVVPRSLLVLVLLATAVTLADARTRSADTSSDAYRAFALAPAWLPFLRSVPSADVDDRGRVGINKNGLQYPELQAVGGAFVIRGLLNRREDWRAQGWRILDAGMVGMSPEGKLAGLEKDLAHSSSFLLYSYGEALVVDRAAATQPQVSRFLTAVGYLAQEPQIAEGRAMIRRFTHRAFLWSFMFKTSAVLDPDSEASARWAALAQEFMDAGLAAQTFDGVFPEVGGFDALYQSIGLDMLLRVTAMETDTATRDAQSWAATRGIATLVARIDRRGQLRLTDSRRVTKEQTRSGTPKTLSHWQIAQPLYGAAILLHDDYFSKVARRVMTCNVACQMAGSELPR